MTPPVIYLDNASTTRMDPAISTLLAELYAQTWANPASQHAAGRRAATVLEDAKDRLKSICIGGRLPAEHELWRVVITSGGTEANNMVIRSFSHQPNARLLVSVVEHPSILEAANHANSHCTDLLEVDGCGRVNIDALQGWLSQTRPSGPTRLVSILAGNNETGVLQDLPEISALCRSQGVPLHCDVVQMVGKIPIGPVSTYLDALTISAHKLHGPVGVGALIFRRDLSVLPWLFGGGQQLGLRPGSESVPLTLALAACCELAESELAQGAMERVTKRRDQFEAMLDDAQIGARAVAAQVPRLPHISSIAFEHLDRQALLMACDLAGIQCSTGSACASGSSQPSHVLKAMKIPPEWANGTLRFSFSRLTSDEESSEAAERIVVMVRRLRCARPRPRVLGGNQSDELKSG